MTSQGVSEETDQDVSTADLGKFCTNCKYWNTAASSWIGDRRFGECKRILEAEKQVDEYPLEDAPEAVITSLSPDTYFITRGSFGCRLHEPGAYQEDEDDDDPHTRGD